MKAQDVMTREVVSIGPDASIIEAVRTMLQHKISGLPVIDASGRLQGVITEGDFLRRAETGTQRRHPRWLEFLLGPGRLATEYVHASGRKVDEVMTPDVYTVTEDAPLEQVVHLMERHRVKRIPVVRGETVVGMVTRANLMRALASLALAEQPAAAGDAAIRERLLAELTKQRWAPVGLIDVYAATIPDLKFVPAVHVNYGETVLRMKDGLPKLRDFPAELGGSGVAVPE